MNKRTSYTQSETTTVPARERNLSGTKTNFVGGRGENVHFLLGTLPALGQLLVLAHGHGRRYLERLELVCKRWGSNFTCNFAAVRSRRACRRAARRALAAGTLGRGDETATGVVGTA